jgi:protein-disulfide isomerase
MADPIETATLAVPVSEQHDHIQGPRTAGVTIVEYGDYECPYCGEAHPVVKKLLAQFRDEARFIFRNFPLAQIHPHAERAAEAAEAAGGQGRFWEMHALLYERQDALEDQDLVMYAGEIDLDLHRFETELAQGVHAARVREDFLGGVRSGVNGTPTFFLNGRRHDGTYDLRSLSEAVTMAMSHPRPEVSHSHHRPHQ